MITKLGPKPLSLRVSEFWTPVSWSVEQLRDHLINDHGYDAAEWADVDEDTMIWAHRLEHQNDRADHHIHYENA